MCLCSKEPETTLCYLLCCYFHSLHRLLNDICALNHSLKNILEESLLKVPLYGAEEFSFKINSEILNCTIKFIKKTVAHYFFLNFFFLFPLTRYSIFFYVFYVRSMYRIYIKQYISYVNFVSCVVLFYYFYF